RRRLGNRIGNRIAAGSGIAPPPVPETPKTRRSAHKAGTTKFKPPKSSHKHHRRPHLPSKETADGVCFTNNMSIV
ncbi:MAG: hypothetical protein DBX40_06865, partial [Clostridiales bacterium]